MSAKLPVDLIVFDLDGTLADSLPALTAAANYACRCLGLPEHPAAVIQQMIGEGEKTFVRRFLGEGHQDLFEKALKLYLEHYSQHCGHLTRLYPEVRETLEVLSHKKLAVLSNKMERLSRQVVEVLGIAPFFVAVKGGDSYGMLKPQPAGLAALIRELQASPERTLMVGDKPTDIHTGRGAGALTLGVTYGYGDPEALRQAAPEVLIDSFSQLAGLVA
ncbi:MAG: HAD-IA family hydrolase [Deltaproteobacteria bacterium]|nr:HAD-IA family hydrolase [Deltaproteobacteria bacterium]